MSRLPEGEGPITREELTERLDALRDTVLAKVSSARAWGVAALIGGQAVAALIARYGGVPQPVQVGAHFVRHLFAS